MQCALCIADAGFGFSLTLEEVESSWMAFVRAKGYPEVVQFRTCEALINVAMGRLMLRRLAETDFSDSF